MSHGAIWWETDVLVRMTTIPPPLPLVSAFLRRKRVLGANVGKFVFSLLI